MILGFSSDKAVKYGLREAIVIAIFEKYLDKTYLNSNPHMFIENGDYRVINKRWWMRTKLSMLKAFFPFWNETQIKCTLHSLIEQKILLRKNVDKDTAYFAFV